MIRRSILFIGLLLGLLPGVLVAQDFRAIDLFIDSGEASLAAWQVELTFDRAALGITGIEAVAPGAKPPVYDSRALQAGKIKLANFSLQANGFGRGPIHVARLHLVQQQPSQLKAALHTAADPDGQKLAGLKVFTRPASATAVGSPVVAQPARPASTKRVPVPAGEAVPSLDRAPAAKPIGTPAPKP